MQPLLHWLYETTIATAIREDGNLFPWIESVHVLAITLVVGSISIVDLRLLNLAGKEQPTGSYAARFLPWIWWTLPVLLVSGTVLIIGEPGRSLENPAFQLKMALLIGAIIVTLILHRPIGREPAYWELGSHKGWARVIAVVSLCLWVGIVFAGRWIAYMNTSGE